MDLKGLAAPLAALTALHAALAIPVFAGEPSELPLCEAPWTAAAPAIDGSGEDKAWLAARPVKAEARPSSGPPVEAELKALQDKESVYILVKWPAAQESRAQSPWVWNAALQLYKPGEEMEDAFTFVWRDPLEKPRMLDVWVWRAGRTDPASSADDMHSAIPWERAPKDGAKAPLPLQFDAGSPCWTQTHHGDFAGERLPRFAQRTPSGSVGDLKARGHWAAGFWTLEISRRKSTGNPDDLELREGADAFLSLAPERPSPTTALLDAPCIRVRLLPPPSEKPAQAEAPK